MPVGNTLWGHTLGELFDFICMFAALALLLALLLPCRLLPLSSNRRVLACSAAAMACCSLGLGFADAYSLFGFAVVAAALGAAGFTVMTLAWSELYASLNPVRGVLCYSLALVLGELIALAFTGYARPHIFFAAAALPLLAYHCISHSSFYASERDPRPPLRLPATFPWKPVVLMAAYSFAFALVQSATGEEDLTYPWRLMLFVPPLIVSAAIVADAKHFSLASVYRVVFPVMLCTLLLPMTLSWFPGNLIHALTSMSFFASGIFCMIILGEVSFRLRVSALCLFAIVKIFNYGGMFAGSAFRGVLLDEAGAFTPVLSLALTVAVAVAGAIMLSERGLFSNWGVCAAGDDDPSSDDGYFGSVTRLAATFGLTAREEEVLHLLAQGKMVAAIADDLFLAQGTVKAHIQHIYQKLGIHSRSELEDALRAS